MPIRVAFTTYYDPGDVTRWSGLGLYMHRALRAAGADVELIGPLKPQFHPVNIARHLWSTRVLGKGDHAHRDAGFLRHYAGQVARALGTVHADVVVGAGGLPLCMLETDVPTAVWTDCTFDTLLGYYAAFDNLSERTVRDGHAADRALFGRVAGGLFSSEWAARSAIDTYGLPADRAVVTGFGANLDRSWSEEDIKRLIGIRRLEGPRLLFIGVDWERKRGDLAVAMTAELRRRGVPASLDAVGRGPVSGAEKLPEWVRVHGFLSKASAGDRAKMCGLLESAAIHVLPTQAEAFGVVFCEASSAGVPSVATSTGGVPEAVRPGINGALLPLEAGASCWADQVEEIWSDPSGYADLAMRSFVEYRDRLNWDVVGAKAMRFLEGVVGSGSEPRSIPHSMPDSGSNSRPVSGGAPDGVVGMIMPDTRSRNTRAI